MNQQESIKRILREIRVPRSERVELYKDDNIIVVVPLTHRALKKYAHECQWCINSDLGEWEDYHQGKHAVIIQRNPKKPKIGITGNPTASEIFFLAKWDNNALSFYYVCHMLDYEFRNDRTMSDYYVTISNDIDNFATNIVYYSPENGIYDQEDNFLWNFNYEITDIPNVTPEVIKIMDDYLQEEKEMSLQESIKRILKEETSNRTQNKLIDMINNTGPLNTIRATGGYMNFKKLYGDDIPKEIRKKIILNFVKKYGDNKNVINTIGDDMFIDVEPLRKNTVNYTTMVKQIYLMGHIVFEQKPKQKSLKAPQVGYLDIIELSDFDLDMIINNLYNRFT